jgi:hypothetical protein
MDTAAGRHQPNTTALEPEMPLLSEFSDEALLLWSRMPNGDIAWIIVDPNPPEDP